MRTIPITLLVVGCSTGGLGDHSSLDNIPKPAAAALRARAGEATIRSVHRETHKGVEMYEASWVENELEREVKVTGDGTMVELEEQVRVADVPQIVRDVAARKLPRGASYKYLRLMGDRWEVEARINGKEHDIVISASGQILGGEVEDDDEDDEEGDDDD